MGPYTAGAICSICFGLPTPAVDGNVLRVVARLAAYDAVIDLPQTKREVETALKGVYETLPGEERGILTQALMEVGACVCVPGGRPVCEGCPLAGVCKAKSAGEQLLYPVRAPKKQRKRLKKQVLILSAGERYALLRRPETGMLAGLWEFPNRDLSEGEADTPETALVFARTLGAACPRYLGETRYTHVFTHVEWEMTAYRVECEAELPGFVWAAAEEIETRHALPTAFRRFSPQ